MMRTTYGVEFLLGLSKVELVLFFMLSCFADGNGLVSLYKDRKVKLCGKLGISSRSLRRFMADWRAARRVSLMSEDTSPVSSVVHWMSRQVCHFFQGWQ